MLILKDRLLNMPVMSLQTGGEVAQTDQFIIDPRQLKVVAFYCKGARLDVSPAILHTEDIREFSDLGLIVDSADNIMSPDGLVRLKDILDYNFTLENTQVVEDTGRKIGKVINFAVDSGSFLVIKLHVKPGVLQAWRTAEVLIDRSQIKAITDEHIVVRAATITEAAPITQTVTQPVVDNPFRQPHVGASTTDKQAR